MSKTEIVGLRRMKTICQLTFQGLPLSILLVRLITYLGAQELARINLEVRGFLLIALLTIAHAILEFALIHLDKTESKTGFFDQCISRFNGGIGFMPSATAKSELSGSNTV